MSGQAALASARKRRVNLPSQQLNGQPSSNTNSYQNELNNIAKEFSKDTTKQERIPIQNVVMIHEKKLNILKKELDELKKTAIDETISDEHKVTFSDLQSFDKNQDLSDLTKKIDSIEVISNDTLQKNIICENRIKTLENEISTIKKDIENFKVIFLNINKIINDLKSVTDSNSNELNTMKSFLNEHTFVSNKESQQDLETIDEENNEENKEENKEENNVNKVEMEIKEKE